MINLVIPARSDAEGRHVVRLNEMGPAAPGPRDAMLVKAGAGRKLFSSAFGLLEVENVDDATFHRDVVSVDPQRGTAERLIRASSPHNTFLATERCDQLCSMCSQPPKKTHDDRWEEYAAAASLAPIGALLGISGGEPTLYKDELFRFLADAHGVRPDLAWHVLSNGQHFDVADIAILSSESFSKVTWGVPLYAAEADLHDEIVGKGGAFERLNLGLDILLRAGAHVELRTVILAQNLHDLPALGRYAALRLGFCDQWSIMQLEAIGFAKNRFSELYVPTASHFGPIAEAIDAAELYGLPVALFNFPRCQVPQSYRRHAAASISDWKRKYAEPCGRCSEQRLCGGFFEWHPDSAIEVAPL